MATGFCQLHWSDEGKFKDCLKTFLFSFKGNLYGRGATDNKGPVLAWINAVETLRALKLVGINDDFFIIIIANFYYLLLFVVIIYHISGGMYLHSWVRWYLSVPTDYIQFEILAISDATLRALVPLQYEFVFEHFCFKQPVCNVDSLAANTLQRKTHREAFNMYYIHYTALIPRSLESL